jgi:opine dehydrogenase
MEIAVLGGGNGCYAAAADLALQGHKVRFWRRDVAGLQAAIEQGGITLTDAAGTRHVPLARVTPDLAAAVSGAALIVIPLPATSQAGLAAQLAPHLEPGQVVYLPPGTFGSYIYARALHATGNPARVAFAETGTLPYLTRKQGENHVAIRVRATRLPTGVFPADDTQRALALLREAYPAVEPLRDALSGALMNAGPIIHPPLILMNAGPLEHFKGDWDIHNEGTQPSIRRVTDRLDAERVALREWFGYAAPHFPLADHYDDSRDEWMYGNSSHERLVDSNDWREPIDLQTHRYMREDVACGLAFLVSLGVWTGVPTPLAAGLLAIASAVCGEQFEETGRTLGSLGLGAHDRASLHLLLDAGFPG